MSTTAYSAPSTLSVIRQVLASLIGYPPVMREMLPRRLHGQPSRA